MEPIERIEYETPLIESFPISEEPPMEEVQVLPGAPSPASSGLSTFVPALRELLETVLLTLVIFFMIRFAIENFRIEGYSMEPNFHNDQFLLVNKVAYKIGHPERGDVIIFHFPLNETKNYIKRVIGLPGEKVQVRAGRVYVDDILVPEKYPIEQADYDFGPVTVQPGEYFVLGDNRPESSDSHFWGTVPARDIVGKAWVSYWPPELWGFIPDSSYANASP